MARGPVHGMWRLRAATARVWAEYRERIARF